MSRLKALLRVAPPSTCNTQHNLLHRRTPVAQHAHTTQQPGSDATLAADWREFERLLAIVGAAYRTPVHEYELMRETAGHDFPTALMCYELMAAQIRGNE